MKPKDLKEKSQTERKKLETEFRDEIFRLRLKKSTGQLEKNHRFGEVKRDLARLLTLNKADQAAASSGKS